MNALQIFNFNHTNVRVAIINDDPWWVAMDVASVLGYSDTQAMTRRLDNGEVIGYTDNSSGQGRNITIINESGLFSCILGSNKPEAKAFKKWVTSEVLPQIRKTGSYSVKELSRKDLALMVIQAEEEIEYKNSIIIEQNRQITVATNRLIDQQPKVDAWQNFLDCDGLIDLGYVAQVCKTGKKRLFAVMRDNKIFFYKGMYNAPYQSYVDQGYFDVKFKPHPKLGPIPVIRCTPKGAEWIYNKFYRKAA